MLVKSNKKNKKGNKTNEKNSKNKSSGSSSGGFVGGPQELVPLTSATELGIYQNRFFPRRFSSRYVLGSSRLDRFLETANVNTSFSKIGSAKSGSAT